jgi:hypothetical protein
MRHALPILLVAALFLAVLPGSAVAVGGGTVTGTVTPTAIAPEVEVCLVESRPPETCSSPNGEGKYTLGGLPTGLPVKVEFLPSYRSRYAIQYYDRVRTAVEAAPLILDSQGGPLEHIDADLELGGAIEGTVTAASGGMPLAGAEVCVSEIGTGAAHGCTETGQAGGYALGGLPPGAYKVGFWGRGVSAEYAPRYYDDEATLGEATAVLVAAGATAAGIDATMAKGARVTGSVDTAATGAPLEGIPVCLFSTAASRPARCVYSGLGGSYSFAGLAAGGYQVGFSLGSAEIGGEGASSQDDGYLTQFYPGVASRSEAKVLMLSGEEVAGGVDAALVTPLILTSIAPPPPPSSNLVAAVPAISPPTKPGSLRCKKGFARKNVKGTKKCVKKSKKHHGRPKSRKKHNRDGAHHRRGRLESRR